MNKITMVSKVAQALCISYLLIIPLFFFSSLFNFQHTQELLLTQLNQPIQIDTISTWQWYSVMFLTMLPSLVLWMGVLRLRKLFGGFSKQQYFSKENIRHMMFFSLALVVKVPVGITVYSLSTVLLSWNHSAGQKILAIKMGSVELNTLFVALTFTIIAWVFEQARDIESENKQFI